VDHGLIAVEVNIRPREPQQLAWTHASVKCEPEKRGVPALGDSVRFGE
jgi:hypothetical protein